MRDQHASKTLSNEIDKAYFNFNFIVRYVFVWINIRVITKLPNSEQSYKGKVKTHNYINRQSKSTTGKLWKP